MSSFITIVQSLSGSFAVLLIPTLTCYVSSLCFVYRHNANKAIIPSAVLRSTLDEMIDNKPSGNPFADDSDDDDDEPKKKKKGGAAKKSDESEPYAASLRMKEGRHASNTLYYVDYTKQANNGNGLLPEDRNELLSNMAKSNAERDQLTQQHKQISAEAAQLESEPKNEELLHEVNDLETRMVEMENKVEEASAYAGSEYIFVEFTCARCNISSIVSSSNTVAPFRRETCPARQEEHRGPGRHLEEEKEAVH